MWFDIWMRIYVRRYMCMCGCVILIIRAAIIIRGWVCVGLARLPWADGLEPGQRIKRYQMASVSQCQREYTHTQRSFSLCVSEFVNSDFISVYKWVSFNLPQKPEELSNSTTVSDESKQDSGSDQSADDSRGQTDDSDSGSAEEDTGLYRPHMSNRETNVAERLRELQLHRAMKEQMSINNKTHPLDSPTDKGKSIKKQSELIQGSQLFEQ